MAGAEVQSKTSDLGVRTVSALVMVAIAGSALWLGGWVWTAFVALVALGVLWEWNRLVHGFVGSPVARGLWNFAGIVYAGVAATVLAGLREAPFGVHFVLLLAGAVIATDVCAYFSGRTFGGPKIAPRISPSKTWAGLLGGMAGAALVLGAFGAPLTWPWAIPGGMLLAIVAQAGDFFESWMKRRAGVKDSGRLIPGHGGLFDRVDGLLAVAFGLGLGVVVSALVHLASGQPLLPAPA